MSVSLIQTVLCLPVETEKEGDEGYCFGLAARSLCSKYVEHQKMQQNEHPIFVHVCWCHPVNLQSWNVEVLHCLLVSCLFYQEASGRGAKVHKP